MKKTTENITRATHYTTYRKAYQVSTIITANPNVVEDKNKYVACGDDYITSNGRRGTWYACR